MHHRKEKFKPEVFKSQLESLRALRQELAIKEKELADQKWIFFLIRVICANPQLKLLKCILVFFVLFG